jgi:hypothetical protein
MTPLNVSRNIALALLLCNFGGIQAVAQRASTKVPLTSDMDCFVAIDGKLVGRLPVGHQELFDVGTGPHTLSAVTLTGEYWEERVEVGNQSPTPVTISLQKALALKTEVSALEAEVTAKKEKLAQAREQNELMLRNAETTRSERQLIAEAIGHYADTYGKQLGLHDSRESASNSLMTDAAPRGLDQTNTTNQIVGLIEDGIALIEMHKAHHNQVVAHAASERMHELEEALKDPLKSPRGPDQPDYLTRVRDVFNGKTPGRFITSPNWVEYHDANRTVRLSCDEVRGVSGGKKIGIHFSTPKGNGSKKKRKHTLHLRARDKRERKFLKTDVYLACEKFSH